MSKRRNAFTMIEVVMATLLVGLLLVAAMNTLGAATRGQLTNGERGRASLLAGDLMAEILTQAYRDPEGGVGIGPDTGEGTTTRADFDDVDDYDGWTRSPPEDANGAALVSGSGLTRSVTVDCVSATNLTQVVSFNAGAKRIIVTVQGGGATLATLTAVVTDDS